MYIMLNQIFKYPDFLAAPLGLTSMTHPPAGECWNAAM